MKKRTWIYLDPETNEFEVIVDCTWREALAQAKELLHADPAIAAQVTRRYGKIAEIDPATAATATPWDLADRDWCKIY